MNDKGGRPRVYTDQADPLKVVSVRLTYTQIRTARKLGDGSPSAGIRWALEKASRKLYTDEEDLND